MPQEFVILYIYSVYFYLFTQFVQCISSIYNPKKVEKYASGAYKEAIQAGAPLRNGAGT